MKIYGKSYLDSEALRALGAASVGHNVTVHETCELVDLENISIGDNVRIDPFTIISAAGGEVKIGSYVHLGAGCYLGGGAGIELSDFVGFSQGVKAYSISDDYTGRSLTNPTIPRVFLRTSAGRINLGRHVIVGAGSVILPSVEIGEGSSVRALSVVNKSLADWGVYTGQPARRIKERSKDLLADERLLLSN